MPNDTITRLDQAIKNAGVPIVGVSPNGAGYKVFPASLQAAAQPVIDAFNPNDPALAVADLTSEVTIALDQQRLSSAIVWAVIDQFAPPATKAKYQVARSKIIAAYTTQPWI